VSLPKSQFYGDDMRLFLDTEFNGFGGELLSMALVPEDERAKEFYCEIEHTPSEMIQWVKDNVISVMDGEPVSFGAFQHRLQNYICSFTGIEIVADWPDDIGYFCASLITNPGERIMLPGPIQFQLDCSLDYNSEVPHHALHDARGIRECYLRRKLHSMP
jgi:hypothetical protein